MNINLNDSTIQPILAVGIDTEKSTFNNMVFKAEEIEEGIISYYTVEQIEYLIKEAIPYITESHYENFTKNNTPLIYVIYDLEEVGVYLETVDLIKEVEDYTKREKKILQCAKADFSIT